MCVCTVECSQKQTRTSQECPTSPPDGGTAKHSRKKTFREQGGGEERGGLSLQYIPYCAEAEVREKKRGRKTIDYAMDLALGIIAFHPPSPLRSRLSRRRRIGGKWETRRKRTAGRDIFLTYFSFLVLYRTIPSKNKGTKRTENKRSTAYLPRCETYLSSLVLFPAFSPSQTMSRQGAQSHIPSPHSISATNLGQVFLALPYNLERTLTHFSLFLP